MISKSEIPNPKWSGSMLYALCSMRFDLAHRTRFSLLKEKGHLVLIRQDALDKHFTAN